MLCKIQKGMTNLCSQHIPFTGRIRRVYVSLVLVGIILLSNFFCVHPAQARPKVGLVLGGGAARGFSHIGLIQALEEAGIPIDIVVGTSMGSIVGGLYAAGYSTSDLTKIVANLDPAQLFDMQYGVSGGIISSEKFELFLRELLSAVEFSQLKLPFYAVVTDLRTGEEVALDSGQVSKAIQASSAIPGLFSPVLIGGRYFVDGGLKNAVPVNVARDKGADVVIAVDVKKDLSDVDYDNILHNIQLTLWFMIDGYVEQRMADADVVIVPDVQYDSYMEFGRSSYFIEEGYKVGKRKIEEIRTAILAIDNEFVFTPYESQGFFAESLESSINKAKQSVMAKSSGVRAFVCGELGFGTLPDVGLLYTSVSGYRLSVYMNGYDSLKGLKMGFRAELPTVRGRRLWLSWGVKDLVKWQLGVKDHTVFEGKSWQVGAAVSLGEYESGTRWRLSSEVKWFIRESPIPLYEMFESYPYVTIGGLASGNVRGATSSVEYMVGVGNKMRLFGLYPTDLRIVLHHDRNNKEIWKLGFQVGVDVMH